MASRSTQRSPAHGAPGVARRAGPLVALLALAALCCLPSIDAPFTHDEEAGIARNRAVHRGAPLREAAAYRFSPDQVRPVFFLTLALESRLHGPGPRGYRILTLLLHLACGLVLYRLLVRASPPADPAAPDSIGRAAALAGTALFLLHPLQSESVLYIWGRSGVEAALLGFGAILAVPWRNGDRASPGVKIVRPALAACLLSLALLTKEEAVVLPLVALVWWRFGEDRPALPSLRRAALLALPVAAFLAARVALTGSIGRQVYARGLGANVLGQAMVSLRMLRLALLPIGQSFDPEASVPPTLLGLTAALACAAFPVAALVLAVRLRRSGHPAAAGLRRACAGVLVAAAGMLLYWIVPLPDLMSERRAYLPLAGGALAVDGLVRAALAARGRRARSRGAPAGWDRAVAWLPAAAIVLALAPALRARARLWADPRRVWEEAARRAPAKARPWINLGVMAADRGDGARAGLLFDHALALEPHDPEALYNRGRLRMDRGDLAGAEADLKASVAADPGVPRARINLAIVLIRRGDLPRAEEQLRAALAIDPGEPRALTNLGEVVRAEGHSREAIALYRRALASDPGYAHAAVRLGVALEALGDLDGALAAYREYLARGPANETDRRAVETKVRSLEAARAPARPSG